MQTQEIQTRWSHFAQRVFSCSTNTQVPLQQLLQAHESPSRAYHNINHVLDCLIKLDRYFESHPCPDLHDAISLAIWYHDAIYEPLSKTNEEDSAAFMQQTASSLNADPTLISNTHRLILITKSHARAKALDEQILADIDLSILASSPDQFAAYSHAIRNEYRSIDDSTYNQARASFLQSMLDLPKIFHTEYAHHQAWESIARRNISNELKVLNT